MTAPQERFRNNMNSESRITARRAGICWTDGEVQDLLDHRLQNLTWTQIAGLHLRSASSVRARFLWVLNGGVCEMKRGRYCQYTAAGSVGSVSRAGSKRSADADR